MTPLEDDLRCLIREQGPVGVDRFMEIALAHPVHGYYMSRDPFGRGGDFTTAPEISQMFGELLGVWSADVWLKMGSPAPFSLCECGPGRGTLMLDALRATRHVPGFHAALEVHLVEISPVLREAQERTLAGAGRPVRWHESLSGVPVDRPVILLANEFLDALPVRQFVRRGGGWRERMVGLGEGGRFVFVDEFSASADLPPSLTLPPFRGEGIRRREGEGVAVPSPLWQEGRSGGGSEEDRLEEAVIHEDGGARNAFPREFAARFKTVPAAVLFVDYGYDRAGFGDTLQAVRKHQYAPVLENVGEADLTAHVDFAALAKAAADAGLAVFGPVGQGVFLETMGARLRADALMRSASPRQQAEIASALARLTEPDKMGALFKVMAVSNVPDLMPEGFA